MFKKIIHKGELKKGGAIFFQALFKLVFKYSLTTFWSIHEMISPRKCIHFPAKEKPFLNYCFKNIRNCKLSDCVHV